MDITDLETGAYRLMAETGLTARELAEMDMDSYARLSKRPTPVEAALEALGYADKPGTPAPAPASQQAPGAPQPPADAPQGLDPNSPEYFHAWRQNRARGGEGKGIFDSVGSRSDAYANAVRQQAGRTAMSPETHHPGFSRVFVNENAQPVQGRQSWYRGA